MKKLLYLAFCILMFSSLTSCSDDEPKTSYAEDITGTWYLRNLKGWISDDDGNKEKINITVDYNGSWLPAGNYTEFAKKAEISLVSQNAIQGSYILDIKTYVYKYDVASKKIQWTLTSSDKVTLKNDQLVDGTMSAKIKKLTKSEFVIYEKDLDGELTTTYIK